MIGQGLLIMTVARLHASVKRLTRSATMIASTFALTVLPAQALELELTPMLGYTFSPDLHSGDKTTSLSTTDEMNFSMAIAWQEATSKQRKNQGQGQVLINYINRDYTDTSGIKRDFSTYYAHFNGVTFMQSGSHTTTIGFGFGGAFFDTENDSAIYPSVTASVGTRHEISNNLSFITEVRMYASLVKDDDKLFCQAENCSAYFNDAVWIDSNISIGLAYRF